jgi:alanyl-tRNA synthetase
MATRKPRTTKTSEDLKKELEEAKRKIAELEKRAYAEELTELIKSTNIVADFAKIQAKVKDITPVAILQAVASAVGIKRLQVTQAPPATRKPRAEKKAGSK